MSEEIHGSAQIRKRPRAIAMRMLVGDILTYAAIIALSLWQVFSGEPDGRIRHLRLVTYLVFFLFAIIQSLFRRQLFTLKDRFLFLLILAWAALASFVQISISFWNGKLVLRSLILSASWFVIAGYQFFIFSSKSLQEMQ